MSGKVKVKYIFPVSFPEGGGGTAMTLQNAKAIQAAGFDVEVLIPRSTERKGDTRNQNREGVYQGITFRYLVKSVVRPATLTGRYLNFIAGLANLFVYLKAENEDSRLGPVIIKGPLDGITLFLYVLVVKLIGLKCIYNFDDFPDYILFPGKYAKLEKFISEKISFKLLDGFIVISTALRDFVRSAALDSKPVYLLPMTVDPMRFDSIDNSISTPENYILYTGFDFNPGGQFSSKDGLLGLITAFSKIAGKFPGLMLVIIGENNPIYHDHVKRLGVEGRVEFLGLRSRNEVSNYQKNARLLVLPRPWSKQAEGGFSSKLGEYLLTGNPVLLTSVGDATLYLEDMKDACFAIPGDDEDFRVKMEFLLQNESVATEIGSNGRKAALEKFNHIIEGKKLAPFLMSFR
ncbi:MAG: glycosyltransferase [Ignavibacteria bacterium]|nr:glycosyltransferase [Ignavibacteria bacterium]